MNEFELIRWIKKRAGPIPQGWLGIGDDAALVPRDFRHGLVTATDAIVEGIDFDSAVTPEQAGRKALAVNLSDMAAMGALPNAFLMTLGVPPAWKQTKLKKFINGVFKIAKQYQVVCLGGDLSEAKQFFCSITILGKASQQGVVLRSGAKNGDVILVTGSFGGSIKRKHYAFTPRIKEGEWLVQNFKPSAMIDVSDGLVQDLTHLLNSSKVAAHIDLNRIPLSAEVTNIQSALSDGEDFELLLTMNSKKYSQLSGAWAKVFPRVALTKIGEIISGKPAIHYFDNKVCQKNFRPKPGFTHF